MGRAQTPGPPVTSKQDRTWIMRAAGNDPDAQLGEQPVKVRALEGELSMLRELIELARSDIRRARKNLAFRSSAQYRETLEWLASKSDEPGSLEWTCFVLTRLTRATFVASRIRRQLLRQAPRPPLQRRRRLRIQPLAARRERQTAEESDEGGERVAA